MKKVQVQWTEFHNYEAVIEIPDNLSPEEEIDWVTLNTADWGIEWFEPYHINIDWYSFQVYEVT